LNHVKVKLTKVNSLTLYLIRNKTEVIQPFRFYQYNDGMGGVDLLCRFVSLYSPTIQKWLWPLFWTLLVW